MSSTPVILITGASRGIGRGIALRAAGEGCSVAVNYLANEEAASETLRLCEAAKVRDEQIFEAVQGDVATEEGRASIVEQTLRSFGRIDALINNAGMAPRARCDITETTVDSFNEVLAANLGGPFFLTQAVAKHWLQADAPSLLPAGYLVVNISSISAHTASLNRAEYCIAKAGLAMHTQLWALRMAAHGVSVLELRPGIMETDMTTNVREKYQPLIDGGLVPQRRWGSPDDVGKAVAAILRGDFPFSTGTVIDVDGGFHVRAL